MDEAASKKRLHSIPRWFPFASLALLIVSILGWSYIDAGSLWPVPGRENDEIFYENLAFNMSQGRGYKFDFADETWRQPYQDVNADGRNDWFFKLQVEGPTTVRAPALPWVASVLYRMFGRSWTAVYVFNTVVLAVALNWLLALFARQHGMLVAGFALITLCVDFSVMQIGNQFMTEALGAALVALLFCSIAFASSMRLAGNWILVGLVFGLAMLTRSNMVAWLFEISTLVVALCLWRVIRRRPWKLIATSAIAFGLGATVVAAPWWHRNNEVTGQFCPFGTAGSIGMTGSYCDAALERYGNWDPENVVRCQAWSVANHDLSKMTLAEQEYLMGQVSSQEARDWISNNLDQLPRLGLGRMLNHLGIAIEHIPIWAKVFNGLLLLGAAIGIIVDRRGFGFWIGLILFLSIATTVLTWSDFGRYLIPVRPILHCACAIGTIRFWRGPFRYFGFGKLENSEFA